MLNSVLSLKQPCSQETLDAMESLKKHCNKDTKKLSNKLISRMQQMEPVERFVMFLEHNWS